MIVCKIELWPDGDNQNVELLGVVAISNDGSGTDETGNYNVELHESPRDAGRSEIWKRGRMEGFPRLRLGPYDLLYRALKACVGNRD